jgi:hypothetical protein
MDAAIGAKRLRSSPGMFPTMRPMESRLIGLFLLASGCGLASLAWAWSRTMRVHDMRPAFWGPMIISIGLWYIVEPPAEMPPQRLTPVGWVFATIGAVAALAYSHYLYPG